MKLSKLLVAGAMVMGLSGVSYATVVDATDVDPTGSIGAGDLSFDLNDVFRWEELQPTLLDPVTINFNSTVDRADTVVQVEFLGDTSTVQNLELSFNGNPVVVITDAGGFTTFPGGVIKFFVNLVVGANSIVATGQSVNDGSFDIKIAAVPIPAAGLLFGSAFIAGAGFLRRRNMQKKYGLPKGA